MKKIFLLLGSMVTGFYAASFILIWILIIISSIFSADIRTSVQDTFITLRAERLVGFLVITQITIMPFIAGWISKFLYEKYKLLK